MEWRNFSTGKICPVCGLVLDFLPWTQKGNPSDEICPCCGIQFGYEDMSWDRTGRINIYLDLRQKWIQGGMKWGWSFKHQKAFESDSAPQNWDPLEQLRNVPKEFLSEGEKY